MKTKFIFLSLLFAGWLGYAQTNPLHDVFSNLEKDRIPNGLLLDAAVETVNMNKYTGTLPDSSFTSPKVVLDVYNTLLLSRLSANAQFSKTSEEFVNDWKHAQQPDVITLGGLFYQYAEFSDITQQNAQNTGDPGTLIVSNGQIQDKYINGVWQNPYQEKRVFAIAPAVNKTFPLFANAKKRINFPHLSCISTNKLHKKHSI